MKRLRILTWHVHGSYLYYLSHIKHEVYLPVKEGRPHGYGGRTGHFDWPENVHEVPVADLKQQEFDLILYQGADHYQRDRWEVLSGAQRELPSIYLEHDPPRSTPTDTKHIVDDPSMLLVHVTAFNDLMWDSCRTPRKVIDHGVVIPEGDFYTGELERGITVVNNIVPRGRRLGADIFEQARRQVPLDLVGMGAAEAGGLGEIPLHDLPAFEGRYRFFFNPIRYTSMGLAVCEAMLAGLPIVGMATTEMPTVIENGVNGYIETSVPAVIERMQELLKDRERARRMGASAREYARQRFGIERFARDWDDAFERAIALRTPRVMEFAGEAAGR